MADLTVTHRGNDHIIFADGPRTSWSGHMVCTCLRAKQQRPTFNCCPHIVWVIRNREDRVSRGIWVWIPIVLPAVAGHAQSEDDWVMVSIDSDNRLWARIGEPDETFIAHVPGHVHRLDVRALLIPHLLGMIHEIRCTKCPHVFPPAVLDLLADRSNQQLQLQALREACHWLYHDDLHLCREHDDSDLVPF